MSHPAGESKRWSKTRLHFGPGAGMLLAIVLGAAPAAWMGLDFAWIVVAIGTAILLLAPWMARAQVRAVRGLELPPACTVHAGKGIQITARLRMARRARMLVVGLVRPEDPASTHESAPRLFIAAASKAADGFELQLPLRIGSRGRSSELEFVVRSSYPLGIVSADRSLTLPLRLTALPRLFPERDMGLQDAMVQLTGASEQEAERSLHRGEASPSRLRDYVPGDARSSLHLRASLRHGRWMAMERPQLGNGLAQVTLHVPSTGRSPSRRSLAAFEAATSMTASIVQGLHRHGMDVELGTCTHSSAANGSPPDPAKKTLRRSLGQSKTTRAHLESLTDVSLVADPSASSGSRSNGAQAGRTAGHSAVALAIELIPVASLTEFTGLGRRPMEQRPQRPSRRAPSPESFTFLVDANGRVSRSSGQGRRAKR